MRPAPLFAFVFASLGLFSQPATAQLRFRDEALNPVSVVSAEPLETGEFAVAGAFGWPGFWAGIRGGANGNTTLGADIHVTYGSYLGLDTAVGGGLKLHLRHRVWAGVAQTRAQRPKRNLSLFVSPMVLAGEGALGGRTGDERSNLSFLSAVDLGFVFSSRTSEAVTFSCGGVVAGAMIHSRDVAIPWVWALNFRATLSVEAAMSDVTLLFAELAGGYGIAHESSFVESRAILRVSLGLAYRL